MIALYITIHGYSTTAQKTGSGACIDSCSTVASRHELSNRFANDSSVYIKLVFQRQVTGDMKAIIYHLKRITEIILLYLVDTLAFIQPTRDSKAVTIVKPDEIGDFILWTDSAKELKSLFPGRKIILIANHVWVDLAKRLPYWDQIIPFDPKRFIRNPFYRVRYLALTRRLGADITIHPVFTRMFLVGDAIVRVSGAGTRITFLGDLSNVNVYQRYISNFWYNRLIRISPGCISEIKRQAELTRAIGAVSFAPRAPRLPRSDHCAVQPRTSPSYYVVCPGTHRRQKQWPAKKVCRLDRLDSRTIRIFGGHVWRGKRTGDRK